MKNCTTLLLATGAVLAILAGLAYHQFRLLTAPVALPAIDLNAYWGPATSVDDRPGNETVLQEVRYDPGVIVELIERLNRTLPSPTVLEAVNFEYGFNGQFLPEFVAYWRDDYLKRWPSREVLFNQMPHYTTNIQGLEIHYIHTQAIYDVRKKTVLPILLLHGWPGSVREFHELIKMLASPETDDLDIVFEVVAPSLPGFGWSAAPSRPGMGMAEMAVLMCNLMVRLGYERFYVHGTDWGAKVGSTVATLFPHQVIGYHSNFCTLWTPLAMLKGAVAGLMPDRFVAKRYRDFHFPVSEKLGFLVQEAGYYHLQATKPDTIGAVLSMNPVALAVYVFEKFSTATNASYRSRPDGGWSDMEAGYRDAILDNIMIYYLTNTITTSSRLYAEVSSLDKVRQQLDSVPTAVPTGCARYRHEIRHLLDWQLTDKFTNLVHSTYHNRGGHFVAMEQPRMLYKDLAKFVRTLQSLDMWK